MVTVEDIFNAVLIERDDESKIYGFDNIGNSDFELDI